MTIRTLYLCYFSLNEPLVQTQVLPYLRQLAAAGIEVNLLTFESRLREMSVKDAAKHREQLSAEGISWFHLRYHKSPTVPATAYDILAGARFAMQFARRKRIDVLHARAHVPMAMALLAQRFTGAKMIFDIRGLIAEEYADAGIWPHDSLRFRLVKKLERAGIRRADQIVVLTERLRDWILAHKLKRADQIEVIPCCVDFNRFESNSTESKSPDKRSVLANRFGVVYAGSLVGLYLVEEMGRFFKALKTLRPDAFFRILSVSPPEQGAEALKRAGLDSDDFEIRSVLPSEVPAHLKSARLGLSLRKSAFAQIAASPTKIPEYLALGFPVVCNEGVGDMDSLVAREQVGVVLREFNDASYQNAAEQALALADRPEIGERCRTIAHDYFDLQTIGGPRYVDVYRRICKNDG